MPALRGVFALLASFLIASATVAATLPPAPEAAGSPWPPSGGLVLAEVMTGGASASDEYVEIANAGSADADLGGCELVYVTASGSTVTRKASFTSPLLLVPGQHLLVANAAGIYGPLADATYMGGLAADGGAVALRLLGGAVIDAVGWGTAVNSYVEGMAAPAPPAKSSIERLPGGSNGNTQDTDNNWADWFVQPNPVPQSLVSTPVPGPSASPSTTTEGTASPSLTEPSGSPTPTLTSGPTPASTTISGPTPTSSPSVTPTTSPTPMPTPTPLLTPTPTPASTSSSTDTAPVEPTGTAIPTPSPSPSALPSVSATTSSPASPSPTEPTTGLQTIAAARAQPVGSRVHVTGVVTVGLGLVGSDALFSIQDSSGGIFIRSSAPAGDLVVGRSLEVEGTLAAPYGQLEIRNLDSFVLGTEVEEPTPSLADLADIGESTEGSLVTIGGTVTSVTTDSGRLNINIGDGTSAVRVLADPPAGLSRSDVARGDAVFATGIVGQHATASGRLDGYRVWIRRRTDLVVSAPAQTATPKPQSSEKPKSSEKPQPSSTGARVYPNLASALKVRGAAVDVVAAVTATAGLLDIGRPTIVVDDGTAAVAVILPDATNPPSVGMRVRVTGKVGSWETGPTVLATGVEAQGVLQAVGPRTVAGQLGSSLEWRLVRVCGRIDRFVKAGVRWRADLQVNGHTVAVLGEPTAAIALTRSSVGRLAVVTGIVRRATSDSSTFQLLPRMALDIRLGPAPSGPSAKATPSSARASDARPGGSRSPALASHGSVDIGSLAEYEGRSVTVAGLVTETAGSTATIDDGTGEVRLGGASAVDALSILEPGDAIEVTGLVKRDGQGLVIEVDPASIVDLPGDPESPAATDGSVAEIPVGAPTLTAATSPAAAASMLRNSPAASPPDGLTILLVLLFALLAAAAAFSAGRQADRLRRLGAPVWRFGRAVRMVLRKPERGG